MTIDLKEFVTDRPIQRAASVMLALVVAMWAYDHLTLSGFDFFDWAATSALGAFVVIRIFLGERP